MKKQQIYFEMPAKKYFGIEALSKSGMVDIYQSPHHYKVRHSAKKEPTKSMIFGSALHLAILEPTKYKNHVKEHAQKITALEIWKSRILGAVAVLAFMEGKGLLSGLFT